MAKNKYEEVVRSILKRPNTSKTKEAIEELLNVIEADKKVVLTSQATDFLHRTIFYAVSDPHPTWNFDRTSIEAKREALVTMVTSIATYVDEIVPPAARDFTAQITYPNVLHYVAENLDSICPFEKEEPSPATEDEPVAPLSVVNGD